MSHLDTLKSRLETQTPDLTAKLWLFPTNEGGRAAPISLGWCCPCLEGDDRDEGWSGYPLLEDEMAPGEKRHIGFVFLMGLEAADVLRKAGRFRLWEGRVIGLAEVVPFDEREVANGRA